MQFHQPEIARRIVRNEVLPLLSGRPTRVIECEIPIGSGLIIDSEITNCSQTERIMDTDVANLRTSDR